MDQNEITNRHMGGLNARLRAAAGLFFALSAGSAMAACGEDAASCVVAHGDYEALVPNDSQRHGDEISRPAVVFLHGYGGSGDGVLKNKAMVDRFLDRGYVVIAPNGLRRANNGAPSWNFYPGWEGRDEVAFFQELLVDAATRFNVDTERTLMAGFSAGGFMVNYLACAAPDTFAAYASVAGGFWRPQPEACAGPIRLHHTHGWSDGVVPLEGRYLRNRTWQQGDIYAGLELWRDTLGCDTHAPTRSWSQGADLLRYWNCGEGAEITFSLHPGGHTIPDTWADTVATWFENAEPSQ